MGPIHKDLSLPIIPPHAVQPAPKGPAEHQEDGRLIRVGNMLQIVTGPDQQTDAMTMPPVPVPIPVVAPPTLVSMPKSEEELNIENRVEEMKLLEAKKEAERKLKREQRLMKLMKQQNEEKPAETKSSANKRILETIQDEEEARILQEAISSVPTEEPEVEVVEDEKTSSTSRTKVRYISLKPLTKKERKRQQKMAAEIAAAEAEMKDEDPDNWTPPSPVHLPDVSTVKPILVQLGFELSNQRNPHREKKSKSSSSLTFFFFLKRC